MEILIYPDETLSTPAEVVNTIDDLLQNLINDMIRTMVENSGIGLAANQVGELRRLFVYMHESLPLVLINPIIEKVDNSLCTQDESCLSIIDFCSQVTRASKITVTGMDREGVEQRFEADGMLARVIQHELDHLDGILFIDHASRQVRRAYNRRLRKILKGENSNAI